MAAWRSALPLLFVAALIAFEDWVSVPSCEIMHRDGGDAMRPDDLKVMMVADLLLLGPDAGYFNIFFRDTYTTKFLRKSFERLKPDMLVVLGDISAKGLELANSKWSSLLLQFQRMLGPFLGLPLHIILGDRDTGECSKLDAEFVSQIAGNLPGLDSAGCGAFEVSNITFVSLNAVALLCGNNDLRFSVEKLIERESLDVRTEMKDAAGEAKGRTASFSDFHWRDYDVAPGSGPVLLLHFPLHHQITRSNCGGINVPERNLQYSPCGSSRRLDDSGTVGAGPYELTQTLPPNATEYIFQALKPRVVFSAHTHKFCCYIHIDGTPEVTVPAMTWAANKEPGFVIVTFGRNKAMTVSHCSLARESHVLMAYVSICVLLLTTTLVMSWSYLINFVGG